MTLTEIIARNTKAVRTAAGLTQFDTAELAFGERELNSRVSRVENGDTYPITYIEGIAKALDLQPWQLCHPDLKVRTVVEIDSTPRRTLDQVKGLDQLKREAAPTE